MNAGRRAVLLDRDGVINRAFTRNGVPRPPASLEELEILPDAPEALARLRERGFVIVVVTNQPDVARGAMPLALVDSIHERLSATLPIDDILVCPHDDNDACECRKPKPGLLFEAARRHGIDLSRSYMIGDRWRDIDAGHAAGCATIWIDYGYAERPPGRPPEGRVASVTEAVEWIINASKKAEDRS